MNGEVMDESTESQPNKNELSSPSQLPDEKTNGRKKEQTTPDPEIEQKNTEGESQSQHASEKNGTDPQLGDSEEIANTNDTNEKDKDIKNSSTKSSSSDIPTNGIDKNEEKQKNMKGSPQPDSELENSNSCQGKNFNNSKDSSMLSTTDTQDEIDTIENGDQIFINHLNDQSRESSQNNAAKKKMLDMDMESEDSLEEMLGSDLDPQTEETFSIVSGSEYDEASQGSVHDKSIEITEIEEPATQNGTKSPEILEIESDKEDVEDCVVTAENKTNVKKTSGITKKPIQTELRRSSRTIKRKKYSYDYDNVDEESDIEEVPTNDPLRRKSRPIMIKDTKSLVEIAARQAARSSISQRREPQLVLIGANPMTKPLPALNKSSTSSINSSLYQSIVARGTTVTPVPSRTVSTTQAAQTAPSAPSPTPILLPSLTDDMFVVEAPSFIVPYVYEKPSIEPFKDFVTKLGKELEEQRSKLEQELLEKKKEEKAKRHKERQERKDRGEEVSGSEEETKQDAEETKKKKLERREKKRRLEEDDESWDGSDSTDSEDFTITDDKGGTIVINDKDEAIQDLKDLQIVPASTSKSDNYFDCSLGKFFMNIGMGLVEEYVQSDLLKQQKRKLQREKKTGQSTKEREISISLLIKNLELSKENNEPFACPQIKCEHCSFKTESALVMAQHLETPHMKNNMYKCNFCDYEIRSPHDILFHMEAEHNVRGKLERAPAYHQCVNCSFEDNGKGKLARHLIACAKKFKPEQNLSPPVEWEPPAKIPKVAKARQSMLGAQFPSAGPFGRPQLGSSFGRPPMVAGVIPGSMIAYRPRCRLPGGTQATRPVQAGGSIVRGSSMLRPNAPATITNFQGNKKSSNQPSISITALPRQAAPVQAAGAPSAKGTFVICEICDGYIKDLDQLRNHMQWIHKVKIHPKMIYNRPPLNCQKCQFRFFTDQGLERHLLGSHGLVTSSMQEAANKSKDAGRCPVCGKVYQWKLLNHVARDHNMTLKPAHLSYKCTVCTATFGMYKLFENHVYSAHSVVAKRVMDKNLPKPKAAAPKGLKINDEITITAQPAKPAKDK